MTRLSTAWKRLKQIEIDSVKYDICVTERDGMYQAAWVCHECCEQGAWAPTSGSASQASDLAQLGLQIHHSLVHPQRTRPNPR